MCWASDTVGSLHGRELTVKNYVFKLRGAIAFALIFSSARFIVGSCCCPSASHLQE